MRTIIDIPEISLQKLALLCQQEDISRAEAIRRAVEYYLEKRKQEEGSKQAERQKVLEETFGAWADDSFWKGRDAVEYIRELRAEWDRPEDPD